MGPYYFGSSHYYLYALLFIHSDLGMVVFFVWGLILGDKTIGIDGIENMQDRVSLTSTFSYFRYKCSINRICRMYIFE